MTQDHPLIMNDYSNTSQMYSQCIHFVKNTNPSLNDIFNLNLSSIDKNSLLKIKLCCINLMCSKKTAEKILWFLIKEAKGKPNKENMIKICSLITMILTKHIKQNEINDKTYLFNEIISLCHTNKLNYLRAHTKKIIRLIKEDNGIERMFENIKISNDIDFIFYIHTNQYSKNHKLLIDYFKNNFYKTKRQDLRDKCIELTLKMCRSTNLNRRYLGISYVKVILAFDQNILKNLKDILSNLLFDNFKEVREIAWEIYKQYINEKWYSEEFCDEKLMSYNYGDIHGIAEYIKLHRIPGILKKPNSPGLIYLFTKLGIKSEEERVIKLYKDYLPLIHDLPIAWRMIKECCSYFEYLIKEKQDLSYIKYLSDILLTSKHIGLIHAVFRNLSNSFEAIKSENKIKNSNFQSCETILSYWLDKIKSIECANIRKGFGLPYCFISILRNKKHFNIFLERIMAFLLKRPQIVNSLANHLNILKELLNDSEISKSLYSYYREMVEFALDYIDSKEFILRNTSLNLLSLIIQKLIGKDNAIDDLIMGNFDDIRKILYLHLEREINKFNDGAKIYVILCIYDRIKTITREEMVLIEKCCSFKNFIAVKSKRISGIIKLQPPILIQNNFMEDLINLERCDKMVLIFKYLSSFDAEVREMALKVLVETEGFSVDYPELARYHIVKDACKNGYKDLLRKEIMMDKCNVYRSAVDCFDTELVNWFRDYEYDLDILENNILDSY
ncbi:hypothetical protein TCON_1607 [Astathelohania contejeani]|uniref:DUF2428 domain-containing protein n=1 Tax=Astathelohania contejeani TaxID=164912 RepID=A0ABQ7HYD3_9MICR|nr:hypothetical protein TCON_1607 [Thelohania contejeani]